MVVNGDLAQTPLPDVLTQLAARRVSGCLRLTDLAHDRAKIFLRRGRVYAVLVPGAFPGVGAALVASGQLSADDLEDALKAQRTELPDWRLGELLVHLGHVAPHVVDAVSAQVMRSAAQGLLCWYGGTWRFCPGEHTRQDVASPVDVADLLIELTGPLAGRDPARRERRPLAVVPEPAPPPVVPATVTPETAMATTGEPMVPTEEPEVPTEESEVPTGVPQRMPGEPVVPTEPVASTAEPVERRPPTVGPLSSDTDLAALLRELSLLGMDEDPAEAVTRPAAARQAGPAPRRRKGLFGLG